MARNQIRDGARRAIKVINDILLNRKKKVTNVEISFDNELSEFCGNGLYIDRVSTGRMTITIKVKVEPRRAAGLARGMRHKKKAPRRVVNR